MTLPVIEPRSPGPLANTLTISSFKRKNTHMCHSLNKQYMQRIQNGKKGLLDKY